jgi:F-type H+-transporting ATPase subunit epsilon
MHVRLVTLSGVKFDQEALEVRIKTPLGAMVVLPHHEPITAQTVPGPVTIIDTKNNDEVFASYGGILEVTNNEVRILLDEADYATELVEAEIEEALKSAQALKAKAKDQKELDEAQRLIDRQAVRLQVAQIRRRHPRG